MQQKKGEYKCIIILIQYFLKVFHKINVGLMFSTVIVLVCAGEVVNYVVPLC